MEEIRVFEDDGTICCCPTRETGESSVDVGRRGDFDIADGESEGGQDFPQREFFTDGFDNLTRSYASHLLVFETGEDEG